MSVLRLDLTVDDTQAAVDARIRQGQGGRGFILDQIAQYLDRLAAGSSNMTSGRLVTGAVKSTGTVTFAATFVEDDTVTINGVVFTGKDSPAGADEFAIGGDEEETAANFAAKINASALAGIVNVVTASVSGAIVTLTCVTPGLVGNAITLAISAHGSVSAARMAGGAEASITSIPA